MLEKYIILRNFLIINFLSILIRITHFLSNQTTTLRRIKKEKLNEKIKI